MEVYSATIGKVSLQDIHITYNATVLVKQNGDGRPLAKVLDRLIPDYVDKDPYIRIYVSVGGGSEGQARISGLSVEYNAIPRMVKPLPEFRIDEDTKKTLPFDLREYFTDDYTPSDQLSFRIALSGSNSEKIRASVIGSQVILDSTITQDFYSRAHPPYDIKGRIFVEDTGGPNNVPSRVFRTNEFPIIVEPENDPPVRTGESIPTMYAYEGETTIVGDLDDHDLFYDVDGDKLNYLIVPKFDDNYDPDAKFVIERDSKDNTITVSLSERSDWTGNVKVRIYATDEPEFNINSNPFIDFIVTVLNVNDAPYWTHIEDQKVSEDTLTQRVIEVSRFAMDADTHRSDLDFQLESYTNVSFLGISTERTESNLYYLNFDPKTENWNGRTTITISVSDGEFEDLTEFDIIVNPVNDIPTIRIIEPVENSRVEPGYFSVVGEAHDIEGIEFVEVYFDGQWTMAKGLNTWGITLEAMGTDEIQESIPIQVRVFDGITYTYSYANFTILPLELVDNLDHDNDGIPNLNDDFPWDPSEWSDRDGDGVGDKTDAFPDDPQWSKDSDRDTIADEADTHPLDPDLWDDKNGDGKNDFLPPSKKIDTTQDQTDYTSVFVLFGFSILIFLIAIVALLMLLRKRDASKDPRKMAVYYSKQQKRREFRHDIIEKLPLAKLADKIPQMVVGGPRPSTLPQPSRPGMVQPTIVRPSPFLQNRPAPALPPRAAPNVPQPVARPMQAPRPPVQRPPQ
jgi:hypothetical protein